MAFRTFGCVQGHMVFTARLTDACPLCGSPLTEVQRPTWRDQARRFLYAES